MYILHETVASNDPRLDPRIKTKTNVWHYTISELNPNEGIITSWLNPVEVTEEELVASKFTNVMDNMVPILVNTANRVDMVEPTSFGDPTYEKIMYTLTATDKSNLVSLMKKMMKLHAENHIEDNGIKQKLLLGIEPLSNVEETQMYMATYFEWECAFTHDKNKTPMFDVAWVWGPEERGNMEETPLQQVENPPS